MPSLAGQRTLERPAGVGDDDSCAFAGVSGAGALDEAGRPDSVIPAVDFLPDLRFKGLVADLLEGLPQQLGVVPAVVYDRVGFRTGPAQLVRHHFGRDQVLQPELRRVHSQVGGHQIEHALPEEARLIASRRAEGAHADLVGEHALHIPLVVGDVVRAGQQRRGGGGDGRSVRADIAAQRTQDPGPHPQHRAIALHRQLHLADVLP